jgi:hypothetical protein
VLIHNPQGYLESFLRISYAQANTSVYLGLSPKNISLSTGSSTSFPDLLECFPRVIHSFVHTAAL